MSVPNQRIIRVQKAKSDKTHFYTVFNLEALYSAFKCLRTIGAIKLFIYIGKNQNDFTLELSRADFMEWSGLAETAYKSGIKELIDKGFLINTGGNNYVFLEDRNLSIAFDYRKEEKSVSSKDLIDEFDF